MCATQLMTLESFNDYEVFCNAAQNFRKEQVKWPKMNSKEESTSPKAEKEISYEKSKDHVWIKRLRQ